MGWREERWERAWAPLLAPSIFQDITVRFEASFNLSLFSSLTAAWEGLAGLLQLSEELVADGQVERLTESVWGAGSVMKGVGPGDLVLDGTALCWGVAALEGDPGGQVQACFPAA